MVPPEAMLARAPRRVVSVAGLEPFAGVNTPGPSPTDVTTMAEAWPIVNVKDCMALLPTPLLAVIVMGKLPDAAGVPLSVAVPSWLSTKLTPAGRAPVSLNAGSGKPVAVIVKLLA